MGLVHLSPLTKTRLQRLQPLSGMNHQVGHGFFFRPGGSQVAHSAGTQMTQPRSFQDLRFQSAGGREFRPHMTRIAHVLVYRFLS